MDNQYVPRQPDKRNAAYESIFGRPSASHHQAGPPAPHPSQMYYHQQQPIHYPQTVDRRTSYAQSFSNVQPAYPPHGPPSIYRQSYPNQPPSTYPHQPHPNGSALYPPSGSIRARSVASNPHDQGIISPQPDEPPDPGLEALTRTGLTPAQAYQAQVYLNSPSGPQVDSNRLPPHAGPSYQYQNGGPSRIPDPPRLSVPIEEDGRFDVDFGGDNNSIGNATDDSSELPWARAEAPTGSRASYQTPAINRQDSPSTASSNRFSASSEAHSSPIHVDVSKAQSIRSSVLSTSPTSFTMVDHTLPDHPTSPAGRRSSESAHTSRPNGPRRERQSDRSMSMSAASAAKRISGPRPSIPSLTDGGRHSSGSLQVRVRKSPIVYPALLSRVAEAFRERVGLTDRVKDGLTYKGVFDGREAVDKIAYIIKTTDRNLALLLGRALDAQKFFHDVTYDHRLRDSSNELYLFRTKLPSPFVSGELPEGAPLSPPSNGAVESDSTPSPPAGGPSPLRGEDSADEDELPSGVFTLLTDCYSPTCSRDALCYSIACPRRLEQQARLNMKPQPGLSKQISRESLGDVPDAGTLWIHSVPQEIVNSVSDTEKKRQEAINEVIYTERDFVRDLEYLRDVWIKRLQESDVIPAERRTQFLEQVYWNVFDILAVNTRLRDALNKRQKSYAVVEKIGDILLDAVPHFGPFVSYGAHQLYGKYEFEKEKNSNPEFMQFVEATERLPESRKLELNAYLTKPTTRLARYPLLLEAVLKHTPDDSPDKTLLPQVILIVREFLGKVNAESGKTENRFNLIQLDQQLSFKPGEEVNLRLREEGREMIYKGAMNKRDGELTVYLFDHAMLFTKTVKTKQHEQLKVYRRPIPLELLLITASEDAAVGKAQPRHRQLVRKASFEKNKNQPLVPAINVKPDAAKGQYWINFMHLGRKYYSLVLWANTQLAQRKWLDNIIKQQQAMRERSMVFDTIPLSEGFFVGVNKVNCAAPYSGGRRVVYGTDDGVYVSDFREANKGPMKVLALLEVVQIDVLEEYQLLIVLSERQVITFPLDALDPHDPMAGLKRAKRISSHTSFFKAGYCLGRMLVCIVKSSQLSSTFKTLEPIDQNVRGRAKPTFRKLLQGGNDTLKMFREFYIPVESTSIHYLKTKMCVGCSRGFEIVDLETLDTQGLLDPNDESLEFVRKRDNLRPMAIYRIHNEFLLCYDEFAFYVNKTGRRSRKDFMVHWEGTPTGFALHEPYVLAFEPSFVEIRHIETGLLSQVIQGPNLRLLFADNPPSVTNNMTYNQHQPGYDMYGQPIPSNPAAYGRGPYGYGPPQMNPYQQRPPPGGPGRDEILMVSDDRVLALRTAIGPQRMLSLESGAPSVITMTGR